MAAVWCARMRSPSRSPRRFARHSLTRAHLDALIDAREADLAGEAPELRALEAYAEASSARLVLAGARRSWASAARTRRAPGAQSASPMRSPGCCARCRFMRAEAPLPAARALHAPGICASTPSCSSCARRRRCAAVAAQVAAAARRPSRQRPRAEQRRATRGAAGAAAGGARRRRSRQAGAGRLRSVRPAARGAATPGAAGGSLWRRCRAATDARPHGRTSQ